MCFSMPHQVPCCMPSTDYLLAIVFSHFLTLLLLIVIWSSGHSERPASFAVRLVDLGPAKDGLILGSRLVPGGVALHAPLLQRPERVWMLAERLQRVSECPSEGICRARGEGPPGASACTASSPTQNQMIALQSLAIWTGAESVSAICVRKPKQLVGRSSMCASA